MRTIKVHPEKSINFTHDARIICDLLNFYKRKYPHCTFKDLANIFGYSETNVRRYYYGIHHVNGIAVQWRKGYTQMRKGACVPI